MTTPVVLIDYGIGNIFSVTRALTAAGGSVVASDDPMVIAQASRIVLPGVGAFGDCMAELERRRLIGPILDYAASGRPLLGICVGMQVLMRTGEEFGVHSGLGLIDGVVRQIGPTTTNGLPRKRPHIGWSSLLPPRHRDWNESPLTGTAAGTSFYFLHSFAVVPDEPADVLAETKYGGEHLCAAVQRSNVLGVQFHPEKSGPAGLALLHGFLTSPGSAAMHGQTRNDRPAKPSRTGNAFDWDSKLEPPMMTKPS
ncbi:imidazole glycerol phosphate synthase subunit HisH [Azospirillum lipoferum]|uniref:Imidazole glycerol phosphate synthase subunit HisH n=1 Tax=Azospirillum lipoferum (strain 4B) TaxID=862719 RepID=G7ZIQ3_AZOL4|nr:imidazole glycerol phosphate synthase subunit HisH [Azospirillum lipoferum]CBS91557.1 Imidazole glycerol phosphate synthase, HisH subunit [Azospirillum lipoferum 4B]